jgi:hypothetical protein
VAEAIRLEEMETATTFADQSPIPLVNPNPILPTTRRTESTSLIKPRRIPTPPHAGEETMLLQPINSTINVDKETISSPSLLHNFATTTTTATTATTITIANAIHLLPFDIGEINQ